MNHDHISKVKFKLPCLCNNSRWKRLCSDDLENISNPTLCTVEAESYSFVLKFATGMKNDDMAKLIGMN